jgi:hypothetical protein
MWFRNTVLVPNKFASLHTTEVHLSGGQILIKEQTLNKEYSEQELEDQIRTEFVTKLTN